MQEPRANLDSFDFLSSDLGQGRSLPSLGGIAVGILAIGRVSIQGVKSLCGDRVVFPRLGTTPTTLTGGA